MRLLGLTVIVKVFIGLGRDAAVVVLAPILEVVEKFYVRFQPLLTYYLLSPDYLLVTDMVFALISSSSTMIRGTFSVMVIVYVVFRFLECLEEEKSRGRFVKVEFSDAWAIFIWLFRY